MASESSNSSVSTAGITFAEMLTVLFVGLKLTHVIAWSWWWVLSPTLIPLGVVLIAIAVILLGAILS